MIYNTFSSQAMPMGATFEMTVSGKVAGSTALDADSQQNLLYGVLALGIVLIIVGAWLYLRETGKERLGEEEDKTPEYADAETLMDAIIALDDAYRAGNLRKEVYQKRRRALKKRLKDLV